MTKQRLQIKRNYTICPSKSDAVSHLQSLQLVDGEMALVRYKEDNAIKTLIGVYAVGDNVSGITCFDSLSEVGNGLQRDKKGTLQVKLSNVNGETNYLQVNEEGLKVVDMGTKDTKTTAKIIVKGGPLASTQLQNLLDKENGLAYIPSGTTLQSLLEILFCQEMWPTSINSVSGTVSVSINKPTITLSLSDTTLEVGTYISANTIAFNENSQITYTKSCVSGMTYGYSNTHDSTMDSSATKIEKTPTSAYVSTSVATLKTMITGFENVDNNTITGNTSLSRSNINLGRVQSGENKIVVSITGQTVEYQFDEIPSKYPCSNLGKTKSDLKTTKVSAISGITTAPTNSHTIIVQGVRYGFWGSVPDDFEITSDNIRSLNKLATQDNFTITSDNVVRIVVAIPTEWGKTIKQVIDNSEGLPNSITSTYIRELPHYAVKGANDYTETSYYVYIYDTTVTKDKIIHEITLG